MPANTRAIILSQDSCLLLTARVECAQVQQRRALLRFVLSCGELASRPTAVRFRSRRLSELDRLVGLEKFETPWWRMQLAKFLSSFQSFAIWACVWPLPPFGSMCLQSLFAESNQEGLFFLRLTTWVFVICASLLGSGKFGTPCERMQWA